MIYLKTDVGKSVHYLQKVLNKPETKNNPEFSTLMKSSNQYFDNLNNPTPSLELARREPTNAITNFPINCDPDVMFLLTILSHMKELPKAEKRKFQCEVMGKLNNELERSERLRGFQCEINNKPQSERQQNQQSDDEDGMFFWNQNHWLFYF